MARRAALEGVPEVSEVFQKRKQAQPDLHRVPRGTARGQPDLEH